MEMEERLRRRREMAPSGGNKLALSVESVTSADKKRFLDFSEIAKSSPPHNGQLGDTDTPSKTKLELLTHVDSDSDSDSSSSSSDPDATTSRPLVPRRMDGYRPAPKMNVVAGFLRLAPYLSASAVGLGLAVSLFYPLGEEERRREEGRRKGFGFWQVGLRLRICDTSFCINICNTVCTCCSLLYATVQYRLQRVY